MKFWGNAKKKKGAKKDTKKGRCERPGLGHPFPTLFGTLFTSFSPFHAVWVLLLFLKGHIPPQMCKKDGCDFFWILKLTQLHYLSRMQKGHKKGCKKGAKRA
jgi:hypothetical protein